MTPIQEAIQKFEDMGKKETAVFRKALHYAAAEHLKLLLPKEKQFAEYVWMQGVATGYESGKNGSSSKPTLPEFLNQLYPEK